MSDIKKFTSGTKVDLVNKKDLIQTGDWILKWSPNSPVNETGFSLFTPGNFDPSNKSSPLGGVVLAAIFYLLDNGDQSFGHELIARANELSKEISDREEGEGSMTFPPGRILN